ncbi:NAD(P)/FAD-dependent oxidoreductase [Streptomyces sp. NPDC002886]|uniref:NAD(P)/FAD-dependent oxidoreductase n=1 Tax=Streptomyces sp. NPDC002886 TaxID=3364667 RepID=UPI00368D4394
MRGRFVGDAPCRDGYTGVRPAYTYGRDPDGVGALRAEAGAARAAGLDASFVTATGLPFPVAGAVKVEDQAQFHPLKYLRGLAADIVARGGSIHEGTRVTTLDDGDPCRLTTDSGATVSARHVVVATHHPVFDHALLAARLTQHRDLVIAGPLPAGLDPHGMYVTEEGGKRSVRTAPLDNGSRLLIVTGEAFTPGEGEDTEAGYARLQAWTGQHFPGFTVTHRWAAQDNSVTDTLPLIGRLPGSGQNVYVATGFAGWGMTGGVLLRRSSPPSSAARSNRARGSTTPPDSAPRCAPPQSSSRPSGTPASTSSRTTWTRSAKAPTDP